MKLTLHLVRKDFLRLRGWLAVWALVLIGEVCLGWRMRSGGDLDWLRLTHAANFLALLKLAIVYPLALLLVQEDALAGTRQFWVTRPVSGARLLAAKWLGVVLMFGGLPVLVALPWWLSCGFGPRDLLWNAMEIAGLHASIALPAMVVASLTDSLQRAFLWTLVLVAAALSGAMMWGFFVLHKGETENMELAWSRTWIAVAGLFLGAVVAVVVQFAARRFNRALAILGGGLALAVAIAGWWPARWSSEFRLIEKNAERAAAVKLEFTDASFSWSTPGNGRPDDDMEVALVARGVPADRMLEGIDWSVQVWRWPGGLSLTRDGSLWTRHAWDDSFPMRAALGLRDEEKDAETERVLLAGWQKMRDSVEEQERRKKLHLAPMSERPPTPPPRGTPVDLRARALVPRSLAARMRTEPPAYEAHEWLQLLRPEVLFEAPVRAGDWQNRAAHRMRVERIERIGDIYRDGRFADELTATVAETWPTTWRDDWAMVYFPMTRWPWPLLQENFTIFAVNRSRGQLQEPHYINADRIRICGVQIVRRTSTFDVPKISRGGKWVDWQPSWLDGATLAVMTFPEEARFERVVKVEQFKLSK